MIQLKLVGLPDLADRMGGDEPSVEFDGATAGDLLRWLQRTHGDPAQTRLLDSAGRLDPDVILLGDDGAPIPHHVPDHELPDGGRLTLVVMVAGG